VSKTKKIIQQFADNYKRARKANVLHKKKYNDFQDALYKKYSADGKHRLFAANCEGD